MRFIYWLTNLYSKYYNYFIYVIGCINYAKQMVGGVGY